MNIKPTLVKTLLATLVLSNPVLALESDAALRVAVVKHATGTPEIVKGQFGSGIKKLNRLQRDEDSFGSSMGLCVAYLQSKDAVQSESACTAAINSAKKINLRSAKADYLKSLSYNNRGISRYINNDISGALSDLNAAVLIDENTITTGNLALIKQYSFKQENLASTTSSLLSD
ncbi:MAG: hypothetical protein QMC62_06260 [Alteromonadaceae bacterium]|jgi:Flp pilus assembly protein TadD